MYSDDDDDDDYYYYYYYYYYDDDDDDDGDDVMRCWNDDMIISSYMIQLVLSHVSNVHFNFDFGDDSRFDYMICFNWVETTT